MRVWCLTDKSETFLDISSWESLCRTMMCLMIEVGDNLSLKKYRFTEEILTEKRMFFFWCICTLSEPMYHLFFYIVSEFLHIFSEFRECFIYRRIYFLKEWDDILSHMISLKMRISICHVLAIYDHIFLCILIKSFFSNTEKWTKYIPSNNRHTRESTDFPSFYHTHEDSLCLVIRMMRCEDILCTIFFFYLSEKPIPLISCDMFDTFFLGFCESSDIHFLYFADDIFTLANICNKFSIGIRFISSKWVIEVYDDDFFFWMMFFYHIKKYHTIDSTTDCDDENIWWIGIFWKCF